MDDRLDDTAQQQFDDATQTAVSAEVDAPFVGRWHTLVSTTNWDKGRIICEWRAAQLSQGAGPSECSDEAWAQLVGGVTSQHVGRLRRVYQRFGEIFAQYPGLYWSHFQAAIDWDDAEMWLEGAIRDQWSVSQMRGKRWEVLGHAGAPPADPAVAEEAAADALEDAEAEALAEPFDASGPAETMIQPLAESDEDDSDEEDEESDESDDATTSAGTTGPETPASAKRRLPVEVDELPDDLADAFEQFKLAILAHRREGWSDTTPEAVLECLDALKQLTLAPLD